eukprot:TRINITY_DN23853_c0_g1_i1.p1 TRINITY_DN23853_c0_g1~~TRINITY_DN23853_c0_g1_i1.p1  ORF type:complete len:774 (-),score=44.84 TRINITY_DN23853_c0_g1_i1:549-2870(-)
MTSPNLDERLESIASALVALGISVEDILSGAVDENVVVDRLGTSPSELHRVLPELAQRLRPLETRQMTSDGPVSASAVSMVSHAISPPLPPSFDVNPTFASPPHRAVPYLVNLLAARTAVAAAKRAFSSVGSVGDPLPVADDEPPQVPRREPRPVARMTAAEEMRIADGILPEEWPIVQMAAVRIQAAVRGWLVRRTHHRAIVAARKRARLNLAVEAVRSRRTIASGGVDGDASRSSRTEHATSGRTDGAHQSVAPPLAVSHPISMLLHPKTAVMADVDDIVGVMPTGAARPPAHFAELGGLLDAAAGAASRAAAPLPPQHTPARPPPLQAPSMSPHRPPLRRRLPVDPLSVPTPSRLGVVMRPGGEGPSALAAAAASIRARVAVDANTHPHSLRESFVRERGSSDPSARETITEYMSQRRMRSHGGTPGLPLVGPHGLELPWTPTDAFAPATKAGPAVRPVSQDLYTFGEDLRGQKPRGTADDMSEAELAAAARRGEPLPPGALAKLSMASEARVVAQLQLRAAAADAAVLPAVVARGDVASSAIGLHLDALGAMMPGGPPGPGVRMAREDTRASIQTSKRDSSGAMTDLSRLVDQVGLSIEGVVLGAHGNDPHAWEPPGVFEELKHRSGGTSVSSAGRMLEATVDRLLSDSSEFAEKSKRLTPPVLFRYPEGLNPAPPPSGPDLDAVVAAMNGRYAARNLMTTDASGVHGYTSRPTSFLPPVSGAHRPAHVRAETMYDASCMTVAEPEEEIAQELEATVDALLASLANEYG